MHLLEGVHKMYYASEGKIQPQHMSFVNLRKLSPDHKGQWKPSELQHAMKLIVESQHNSVNYDIILPVHHLMQ